MKAKLVGLPVVSQRPSSRQEVTWGRQALTLLAGLITGGGLLSCMAAPTEAEYQWPAERVMEAANKVMSTYPSSRKVSEGFETGWEDEFFRPQTLPWGSRWIRVKYQVRVLGNHVSVGAFAEAFVSAGAHHHQWQRIDAAPFTARLLDRILEHLQSDEHPG